MEWLDIEIKLFIKNKGPFNLYAINYCLKSHPSTPLMSFTVISLDWTGLDFDLNPLHSIEDRVWLLELQDKSNAVI